MIDSHTVSTGAYGESFQRWWPRLVAALQLGQAQVLVTVVRAQGSTPRDPGARMWVSGGFAVDTIGGGHLEWKAIAHARMLLEQKAPDPQVIRYPLGPGLGQCCGGVVWLAYEYLDAADLPWCMSVETSLGEGRPIERRVPLAQGGLPRLTSAEPPSNLAAHEATCWDESRDEIIDWINPAALTVVVCGAGHVGHAVVRILAELPLRIIWLDPRDDCWPETVPANVHCVQGDADDVRDMPDEAYWLVLTHNHALDLAIIEALFQSRTFRFLGLIGSKTKKARFVSRLGRRFPPEQIARIQCPIGLVETSSKLPAVIAVSVVAQLLPLISL